MVLRRKSVGEQDAAGHQGAFCQGRPPPRERGASLLYIQGLCSTWNGGRGDCAVPSAPSCDVGMTSASPSGPGGGA